MKTKETVFTRVKVPVDTFLPRYSGSPGRQPSPPGGNSSSLPSSPDMGSDNGLADSSTPPSSPDLVSTGLMPVSLHQKAACQQVRGRKEYKVIEFPSFTEKGERNQDTALLRQQGTAYRQSSSWEGYKMIEFPSFSEKGERDQDTALLRQRMAERRRAAASSGNIAGEKKPQDVIEPAGDISHAKRECARRNSPPLCRGAGL